MKSPLIVVPTGGGKSAILGTLTAEVVQHPDSRVLILSHRAELLKQDKRAIELFTDEPVGLYSAMLKKKDTKTRILVAGINSVYKKGCHFDPWDVIIIDECHLLSRDNNSMYRRFLNDCRLVNPKLKLVGLSATIYRLDSGYLHQGKDAMFDGVSYEVSVKYLLENGYLSPVVGKRGVEEINLSGVHKRGAEWIPSELAAAADIDSLTKAACDEMVHYGRTRRSWLVFCAGLTHAYHVAEALEQRGIKVAVVDGNTKNRDEIYRQYETQEIQAIVSVGVLTTGFDAPYTDMIVLLTSTESTGLYVQMVGRGTRIFTGKIDCLLLDYGHNVVTHGCFDDVRPKFKSAGDGDSPQAAPAKECPSCRELCHAGVRHCPNCDYEFPPPQVSHDAVAYNGAVMTTEIKPDEIEVSRVSYSLHQKPGKPDSVKVDYHCGWMVKHSEWLCPEHRGAARRSFEDRCIYEWGIKPLGSVKDVLEAAEKLPKPTTIQVLKRPGERYAQIVGRTY